MPENIVFVEFLGLGDRRPVYFEDSGWVETWKGAKGAGGSGGGRTC